MTAPHHPAPSRLCRWALAAALALPTAPALATVIVSGAVDPFLVQDGNTIEPDTWWIGQQAPGSVQMLDGGTLWVSQIVLGNGPAGDGRLLVDGRSIRSPVDPPTWLRLRAPRSGMQLVVGQTGRGEVQVSGGAFLDAHTPATDWCLAGNCGAVLGLGAGASGLLRVTDTGSEALFFGPVQLSRPIVTPTLGTPGGISQGRVEVLAGGLVRSASLQMGSAPAGVGLDGTERAVAQVLVDGPGSRWLLGQPFPGHVTGADPLAPALRLDVGQGPGSTAALVLRGGGQMVVQGDGAPTQALLARIGSEGGLGQVLVTGADTRLALVASDGPTLVLGSGRGLGELRIDDGGQVLLLDLLAELDPGRRAGSVQLAAAPGDSALLSLQSGGLLAAQQLAVGPGGLLDNSGRVLAAVYNQGLVQGHGVVEGSLHNTGTVNPGDQAQPAGSLAVLGSFSQGAGGRLVLDVLADGSGGFVTDQLLLGDPAALALAGSSLHFHFVGAADPLAFQQQQLFQLGQFLRSSTGGAALLEPGLFDGVAFSAEADAHAISGFRFSAVDGASFSATPVPEPATAGLLLAGLAGLGGLARRRRGR